ncbi:ABC transporter substrate-binding protein [Paenibacillus sacheonensis]|uniref:Extracellular solute-binding protein n=1 Tax=Paenibacillus sacheonensis TaxID=742054 RepID=A0A7X4YLT7_9BACL|nr:ABC transporter substrate-binding protein [Paenibacillus sacheonensis]MBM7565948.1 ABC-type glycerol-3-phosphate transport system substrate-binding protein [Paenibacillus sacheonensis]NBC68738.1 extracellular solute-binding protein [Paenibacillus sacheonensis]
MNNAVRQTSLPGTGRIAGALLLCTVLLAGCNSGGSGDDQGPVSNEPAQPANPTTLTVLTNRVDWIENGVLQQYADQFEAKHPGTKVEFDGLANYASDIMVRLSTRSMGDALLLPNNLTNEDLVNYFEPLHDEMFANIRFADFKAYRGVRYGIATGASTEGIVYNKAAFREAGITTLPATLDEFYEACRKLKAAGMTPIYLNYGAQWPMSSWGENLVGFMTGNPAYLNEMTKSDEPWQIDNPWGHAITIVRTLIQKGYGEKDMFANNWELSKSEVASGQAGMYFIGNWVINQVIEAGAKPDDIGFFPFPYDNSKGKRYAQLSPDWFLGVSKFSEHKELAEQWVDFFVNQSGYVNDSGFLPVDETKTSSMPQIRQFESYRPTYIERQPPSDDFLNIAAKAQVAFWSGDFIQNWAVAKDLKAEFQKYNGLWKEARNDLLGTQAAAKVAAGNTMPDASP